MTNETMHKILELNEQALQDEEYLSLHKSYAPAQQAYADLFFRLSPEDRKIAEDYLLASVSLYHRILAIAFTIEKTGS